MMFLGSFDKPTSSLRVYYLKDEHYISTFLVEVLTGTEYISTQKKKCEKTIVGVENLYNEITKFKENNNENTRTKDSGQNPANQKKPSD